MKNRIGFVSNSSSSSFVITNITTPLFSDDFLELVSNCVFHIQLDINPENQDTIYQQIINIVESARNLDRFNSKYMTVDIEDDSIEIGNIKSLQHIQQIIQIAKNFNLTIHFYTGGTDSAILSQAMIQSYLIDTFVDYDVVGDGSFDLRNSEDIVEILKYDEYPGPAGAILRYYYEKKN